MEAAGHFTPEMLQNANQMAMYQAQGMTAPSQAPNPAMAAYGMNQHMGQEVQGQGAHPHPCQGMAQQGYMQGHMGMHMGPDGTPMVMPYAMDGSGQQNPQHAQAAAQQMMYQQHCGGGQCAGNGGQCGAGQCGACQAGCQGCQGGCPGGCCQGGNAACGGCPGSGCSGCAGGCPANCGGYTMVQIPGMPQGMMMPTGQMNMAAAGAGQQQPGAGQAHPGMQFVMVGGQGGAPGQMQHAMQGMPGQLQGQMQQMAGVQGGMPQQMPGHMGPDGHPMGQPTPGPCGQMALPDQGKGCQGTPQPDAGDGKGGGARVAAGLGRNTQPKQGANWQQGAGRGAGRSTDNRPFEPNHQEQAPAVPGEQGKGAQQGQAAGQQDGNQKGNNKLRNPKNPWADIQDSVGLDQEMHQLWDMNMRPGQIPNMDSNQKAGNYSGQSKGKKGKDGGKDGGKHNDDNMGGGGKGGKDMPQQKWVEKTDPGKGQRGGWQPKDMLKQQAMFGQQMPMSPGGKSNSKGGYQQPVAPMGNPMMGAQSPGPNKNKKKGSGRDPEMDDWLSQRFRGEVPATPTGSMAMGGEEMWGEEEDPDARRRKKGGGKGGGGGKGQNGKSKGGNGGGKGKAKGGRGGGNWQRAN